MRFRVSSRQTVKGHAFADHIGFSQSNRKVHPTSHLSDPSFRTLFVAVILFLLPLILIGRLLFLQIIQGWYYSGLSNSNRIRTEVIHAPRGIIFDRYHTPLVFNMPGFRKEQNGKTELLTTQDALSQIAKGARNIEVDSLRQYPYKDSFSHVVGYIGQISADELKESEFADYKSGDLIGKMGLEQEYEHVLRGTDGRKLIEVDATGKSIRTLGQSDPVSGQDITTTLDHRLEEVAYDAMKDVKAGALVVTNPRGEVLALVSKPSFDPNLFTLPSNYQPSGQYTTIAQVLLDGTTQPLLNRAISGTYPPGSTFKLVTASSALANHIIDDSYEVQDNGVITVGAFSFSNWYFTQYGRTEGPVNVVKAIKRSNDIFFYTLASKVGVDVLSKEATSFGLGQKLGIDLVGEAKGVVPTEEWKEKHIGEPWYLGDTYHYGIGQGYLLTTPLQVNAWTQAIANGGVLYRPHLVSAGNNQPIRSGLLDPKSFDLIREGMVEACSPGGVAWPLFDFKVKNSDLKIDGRDFTEVPAATTSAGLADYRHVAVACKTGTAQHGDETTEPHAWITLFAPAYDPQIVVTVLSESSGEGSNVAAPIAQKVLSEWFSR